MKKRCLVVLFTWIIIADLCELVALIWGGMQSIYYLTWNGIRGGLTPDLFETIWQSAFPMPYEVGAIYPPLVYCALRFFLLFISEGFPLVDRWSEIIYLSHSLDGVKIFIIFSLIIFITLAAFIYFSYHGLQKEKVLLFIFFVSSSPFIYMYERGNTVIFSLFFMCIYFMWYNSPNEIKREIAVFFLSIAICWKIYPILAGLLLLTLKDKKYILHAIGFTICMFFIPFYFTGGISSFNDMLNNILGLSSETVVDTRDFGLGFKVNIDNFILALREIFDYDYSIPSRLPEFLLFFILLLLFVSLKNKQDRVLIVLLMMITIPPFSWIYNVIYLFIPLVMFLNKKKYQLIDVCIIFMLFFSLVPLPYGYIFTDLQGVNPITLSTAVCNLSLYSMIGLLLFKSIFVRINKREESVKC